MVYESKPWLKSYDPGVPAEVQTPRISVWERLDKVCRDYADRPAAYFLGVTLSYGTLTDRASRLAAAFQANGLGKGDVVAVNLPNCPQYLIALVAAQQAGCVVTGVSPLLTGEEMAHQLNDSGARALVTLDALFEQRFLPVAGRIAPLKMVVPTGLIEFLPKPKQILAKMLKKVPTGRIQPVPGKNVLPFQEVLAKFPARAVRTELGPDDPCFIQYTGGTTGLPKGAVLSHGNMLANFVQFEAWFDMKMGQDLFMSCFPMFHQAGLFVATVTMYFGGAQVLVPDPRNTKHIVKEMAAYRPTMMGNVPSLYLMLLNDPGFGRLDFARLRTCISGAAPFPVEGIKALEDVVGAGKVCELYGMTETSPLLTVNPYKSRKKVGSVGLPLPSTRLKLVDLSDGDGEVPLGEEGEVVVRGPQIMAGYHQKPGETSVAMREHEGETWLHTGDVGRMDEDGFLYIVDRAKDMLNVGGYKVFSREVEDKFYEHPAIEFCAIVGLANPQRPGSEIVKLVVQKSQPYKGKPDESVRDELTAFAREKMAPYKVPKVIEFVEAIPLTSVGKVDKKALR